MLKEHGTRVRHLAKDGLPIPAVDTLMQLLCDDDAAFTHNLALFKRRDTGGLVAINGGGYRENSFGDYNVPHTFYSRSGYNGSEFIHAGTDNSQRSEGPGLADETSTGYLNHGQFQFINGDVVLSSDRPEGIDEFICGLLATFNAQAIFNGQVTFGGLVSGLTAELTYGFVSGTPTVPAGGWASTGTPMTFGSASYSRGMTVTLVPSSTPITIVTAGTYLAIAKAYMGINPMAAGAELIFTLNVLNSTSGLSFTGNAELRRFTNGFAGPRQYIWGMTALGVATLAVGDSVQVTGAGVGLPSTTTVVHNVSLLIAKL